MAFCVFKGVEVQSATLNWERTVSSFLFVFYFQPTKKNQTHVLHPHEVLQSDSEAPD